MQSCKFGLIGLCLVLAACNSKTSDPAQVPSETASQVPADAAPATPAAAIKPAPEGLPSRIAKQVITTSGEPCANIVKAERDAKDGSIVASCSGGENYRVYTVEGQGAIATRM